MTHTPAQEDVVAALAEAQAEIDRLTPKTFVDAPGTFSFAPFYGAVVIDGEKYVPYATLSDSIHRHAVCFNALKAEREKSQAMHRRAQVAEGRLAKLSCVLSAMRKSYMTGCASKCWEIRLGTVPAYLLRYACKIVGITKGAGVSDFILRDTREGR